MLGDSYVMRSRICWFAAHSSGTARACCRPRSSRARAGWGTARPLPGLRRIQPRGSPFVGWLRGSIRERVREVEAGR